jgi:hypothetical protein
MPTGPLQTRLVADRKSGQKILVVTQIAQLWAATTPAGSFFILRKAR